jgi:hypothetical protein
VGVLTVFRIYRGETLSAFFFFFFRRFSIFRIQFSVGCLTRFFFRILSLRRFRVSCASLQRRILASQVLADKFGGCLTPRYPDHWKVAEPLETSSGATCNEVMNTTTAGTSAYPEVLAAPRNIHSRRYPEVVAWAYQAKFAFARPAGRLLAASRWGATRGHDAGRFLNFKSGDIGIMLPE